MNLSVNILSNGIKQLLEQEDEAFKKSMVQCLSLKLNDAIFEVNESVFKQIFEKHEYTEESPELKYFVEFIQNYNSKFSNRLKLKNQTVINISESEMESLKNLFESLSPKNRNKMVKDILTSPYQLKQNINFYQKVKSIL